MPSVQKIFAATLGFRRKAAEDTPKVQVQCQWETVDNQVVLQKAEGAPITVNVRDSTGKIVAFKVTMDTQFKDIFAAYAEKELVELKAVRFIYDGARVSGNGTPQTFEMVENCCVDVTIPQRGGGCFWDSFFSPPDTKCF